MANLSGTYIVLHETDKFEKLYIELKGIKNGTGESVEYFQTATFQMLIYRIGSGKLQEGIDMADEIEQKLEKFKGLVQESYRLSFCYNLAIGFFMLERYSDALHWVNKIVNSEKSKSRQDIQDFAVIFRLLLFYCTGKYEILDHHLRATTRTFKTNDKLYEFESLVIENLKKLVDQTAKKKKMQTLAIFKTSLSELYPDNDKQPDLGLEVILMWLDSQIREVPLQEVFLESLEE